MSLRNKITILSITLMSLMTIPTLAENDNQPVNSRIESAKFDVQIKTPEGWSETKDFTSIPETFTFNGQDFRGLQFKNGSELHGCAIFFTEENLNDDKDTDDSEDLFKTLAGVQELAFPGSALSKFTLSKFTVDGSLAADANAETARVSLKGTVEGTVAHETGDPTQLTISGSIKGDTTKGNFILGTGTVVVEGATLISGTTGLLSGDNYNILIAVWGTDEESQVRDAYLFLEGVTVNAKAPLETVDDKSVDNIDVVSETAVEVTSDAVVVTESITVVEVVEEAPVTTEA